MSKCGSELVESVPPKAVSMVVRSLPECCPRSAVCPGAVQCFVHSEEMPYAPVAIPNRLNLPHSQSISQFGISHCPQRKVLCLVRFQSSKKGKEITGCRSAGEGSQSVLLYSPHHSCGNGWHISASTHHTMSKPPGNPQPLAS